MYWDEASIGYNAYSVLQTGKDEWGEKFPIHFRAFGEFKLPVFIYSVVPNIALFGLNEFAVRFPAVLYSLGVVILTYLLAKIWSGSKAAALLSSFFISVSPWFFIFSRTGYEADVGLFFYLLGIYLFINLKNRWYILFSVLSFILSYYSYNSFRLIVPLAALVLIVFYGRSLKPTLKKSILPLIMAVVLIALSMIPIFRLYKYDSGASRFQAVGAGGATVFTNYLSHFSLDFLLFSGDRNLRSQQKGFGQLYLPELILLGLGLIYICRKPKSFGLVLILALLGPIPAALTKESPHALRSLSMVPFLAIISAFGVSLLLQWVRKAKLVYFVVAAIFLIYFMHYFLVFLVNYPTDSANDWQYEYKTIYTDFKPQTERSKRVLISDRYAQPYIFALFYLQYDPQKFKQEAVRSNPGEWGFSTVRSFDKFEFGKYPNLFSFR